MLYIGVDFDGTVVEHKYPRVGKDVPYAVETLKKLSEKGYLLILNTMRSGEELDDAVEWFKNREIPLYGINNNPDQNNWTTSPKVWADLYIDDCGYGIPLIKTRGRSYVNWLKIKEDLIK